MKFEVFNKIIDRLEAVASQFADDNTDQVSTNEEVSETMEAETTEETSESFAEAVLVDGTVVSYEGDLAPGTAVYIVTEEGDQVPAPEGTHAIGGELEGLSIVVDADGVITEVIDERVETASDDKEEEKEEEMSIDVNVEEVIDEKMSELVDPINKIAEGLEALVAENSALKSELEGLKSEFNEFKQLPSAIEEKSKFSRAEKRSVRENYLLNLRKNR